MAVQVELLKQEPAILIATPGRLLDLVDDEECNLSMGKPPIHVYEGQRLCQHHGVVMVQKQCMGYFVAHDETQLCFHSF